MGITMFFLAISAVLIFTPIISADGVCQRSVTEYLLPTSQQTHEIAYISGKNMLLITQFSNSKLVKATTAASNQGGLPQGAITAAYAHQIGDSESGLHGLTLSKAYPNMYWVSLEKGNKLILLDPVDSSLTATPIIIKKISVPEPGSAPHHIAEYGTNMWATLKVSLHILRINHQNPSDFQLFQASPIPVLLAQHPISMDIYASEYKTNTILRINPSTGETSRINVPAEVGQSPVGIVANGNYAWVSLLSIQSSGTGAFGKIFENGTVQWFQLKTAIGKKAALLHIAFDLDDTRATSRGLWLLGSTVEDPAGSDMIIRANFDANFNNFDREVISFLPSQRVKAHRFAISPYGLYVTELTSSRVAFYQRSDNPQCDFTFQNVDLGGEEI